MTAISAASADKPRVVFFQRKPLASGNYSIEFIFADLRSRLSDRIDATVAESSYHSRGILRRLVNTLEVIVRQGDVNVITGDIQYVATLMHRRKNVLVIHDCGHLHMSHGLSRWIQDWIWFRIPIARSARIVTVSEFTRDQVLKHFSCSPDKVVVIPVNICDDFRYRTPRAWPTKPVLLQVGQASNKNLPRIIEAIRGLNVQLHIVGHVSQDNIDALERDRIDFASRCNLSNTELLEEYAASDVLVFPSTYEGFGMPILEAQAVGRPVVTSNIASMPWVAGDAACLVDPFSVSSIRDGISKVLENEDYRRTLIQRGLENIKRFDQNLIAAKYYDVIRDVLATNV